MPLHALMELGGWSDIAMVRKYAHPVPDALAKYAEAMCQFVPVSGTKLRPVHLIMH